MHSDLDLIVVVLRKRSTLTSQIRNGTLVTILQRTPEEARQEVVGGHPGLSEALSGWRSMRALYDPRGLLASLRARSRRPTASQFREAARRALLDTYEDLGKLRDAVAAGDVAEAREMAIWFTGGAMALLFDLKGHVLQTGRLAFIEARRLAPVGGSICDLRYRGHSLAATSCLAESIWADLSRKAHHQGIRTDDVP